MGLYGFSGALTNWLAIHMLFEKVPGLYGSGIITERFEDFKAGIKDLIMNQFFTKEHLQKFMLAESGAIISINENKIISTIDFDMVFNKLKSAILESSFGGMLNMFGGVQALDPLKPQFEQKFKEIIKEILANPSFAENFNPSNNNSNFFKKIEAIVNKRLDELSPNMVKEIIQKMIKKHLGWLVVWGGVFGALIGFASTFI